MFAVLLFSGATIGVPAVTFAVGVALGYAFRGKEHAAIVAAGSEVKVVAADVAKKV
jgi:hypothetical protein